METFFCISLVGTKAYFNGEYSLNTWNDKRFRKYKNYAAAHNDAVVLSQFRSVCIKKIQQLPNGNTKTSVLKVIPKKAKQDHPFAV